MKSGKPRRLTKLRINEISLVDRGAGRGVHIALAKRDSHPGPVKEATVKYLKKIMKSLNRAVVDSGEILPPYTREQLYEDARRLGIEGRSKMNKEQLRRAVDAKK